MLPREEADSGAGLRERSDTVTDTANTVIGARDRLRIPSKLPPNHGFCTGDEYLAGFIAVGHKEGPFHAPLGDGRDVGIGSIFERPRSVCAYERRPAVDNRVGVGTVEGLLKTRTCGARR
jgi:hypothetical protein